VTLEQVAFDIETTGFGVDDEVTTVGFAGATRCVCSCKPAGVLRRTWKLVVPPRRNARASIDARV